MLIFVLGPVPMFLMFRLTGTSPAAALALIVLETSGWMGLSFAWSGVRTAQVLTVAGRATFLTPRSFYSLLISEGARRVKSPKMKTQCQ